MSSTEFVEPPPRTKFLRTPLRTAWNETTKTKVKQMQEGSVGMICVWAILNTGVNQNSHECTNRNSAVKLQEGIDDICAKRNTRYFYTRIIERLKLGFLYVLTPWNTKINLSYMQRFCLHRTSGVTRIFVRGASTNSVEDRGQRERGSGRGSRLVRGSGGSCNLAQGISFHIVKFS